jgi:HAD superfamily hydrolase (TIGR01509 family)
MIEAVIFDMDGLLVDSEPYWDKARRQIAVEAGKEWHEDDHRACMGVSTLDWANYMLDMSPQEVQDRVIGKILEFYARGIPYMPGAEEAVALAARRYPTGLASGSHRRLIEAVIDDPPMRGKFQVVVCSDDVPAGKPAPDVYLEVARRLGVVPERCLCLEDSASGILAGRAAGMQVIAVPDERFMPALEVLRQADVVLPSLTEFRLDTIENASPVHLSKGGPTWPKSENE